MLHHFRLCVQRRREGAKIKGAPRLAELRAAMAAMWGVETILRGQEDIVTCLDESGINPLVVQRALPKPPDEVHVSVPEKLDEYRFIYISK